MYTFNAFCFYYIIQKAIPEINKVASINSLLYNDNSIDHIINNVVLHFAESTEIFVMYFLRTG